MKQFDFAVNTELKNLLTTHTTTNQKIEWVGLRHYFEETSYRKVRNEMPDKNMTSVDEGLMLEVLINGQLGYQAIPSFKLEALREAFAELLQITKISTPLYHFKKSVRPQGKGHFKSARAEDLNSVSVGDITAILLHASAAMKISDKIITRQAVAHIVNTKIALYSSDDSQVFQDFSLVSLTLGATASDGKDSQSRSYNKTGQWGAEIFDEQAILKSSLEVAQDALTLLACEDCPAETMDLILMPDQMMLQIHESIGHPLELDRILGDERNYAGWSFVTQKDFGTLKYGSDLMNVSFDPNVKNEYASYAFDDSGNEAKKVMLIENGLLKRGLGSLESQARLGIEGVANARASSWNRAPIDRMANLNIEPGQTTLPQMIASVKRGVLMKTNSSWSIDDYRNKFQFGCEIGYLIENGKITKTLKNPNYRGVTVDFWNKLAAVGQADEWESHGTYMCGKGEPNQVIRVGHASPPCLFKNVEVFGGGV